MRQIEILGPHSNVTCSTLLRLPRTLLFRAPLIALFAVTLAGLAPQAGHADTFTLMHAFSGPHNGTEPESPPVQAADGNLYGTTQYGGKYYVGTIYRLTPKGALTTLYTFGGATQGATPSGLTLGADGNLYGTTSGAGTVFRCTTSGAVTYLHTLNFGTDGYYPSGLTLGADGNLYGTTNFGGPHYEGTLFKVTTGGTFTTLYSFSGDASGGSPTAPPVLADDGRLYGTTTNGGTSYSGTLYSFSPSGGLTTIYTFAQGYWRQSALTQASDHNLYGETTGGGQFGYGTLFRVTTAGSFSTLYSFTDGNDGGDPSGGLTRAADGYLYGSTREGGARGLGTLYRLSTAGAFKHLCSLSSGRPNGLLQSAAGAFYGTTDSGGSFDSGTVFAFTPPTTLRTLHSFINGPDGTLPRAPLIQGAAGRLYGAASSGGVYGAGAIYAMTSKGSVTTLYSFRGKADGSSPTGAMAVTADGSLYGTTVVGGSFGYGTIFKLTPEGAFTTLYSFTGGADGAEPYAGLVLATDGNLYGATSEGWNPPSTPYRYGTIFKVTPAGAFTTLYSFTGAADGSSAGQLIQGAGGNLYGASGGGANGAGTLFSITTSGALTTLYSFSGGADGGWPKSPLVQAPGGSLYGVCQIGGNTGNSPPNGNGTIFKCTPGGTLTTLYSFTGGADGAQPTTGLVLATDGNLYGTTFSGPNTADGTIFQCTLTGALTTLHTFAGEPDGANPTAPLVQVASDLYGTAWFGGEYGQGVIFRIGLP